jgi:MoxR-like ATPase
MSDPNPFSRLLDATGVYNPDLLPEPPWRQYKRKHASADLVPRQAPPLESRELTVASHYEPTAEGDEYQIVIAALALRRPMLITGPPGVGKSSLAQKVAQALGLGQVLKWSIDSQTRVQDGLYSYDAIGRLQEGQLRGAVAETPDQVGRYFKLGPLGTALLPTRLPRVLLIDEIDKCGPTLPNDLLNVFEDGGFSIDELARLDEGVFPQIPVRPFDWRETEGDAGRVRIKRGRIDCHEFPLVIMTSNGERDFPQAFKRRCLRWEIKGMSAAHLKRVVDSWFPRLAETADAQAAIAGFIKDIDVADQRRAVDQLLSRFFLEREARGYLKVDQVAPAIEKPLAHIEGTTKD